MARRRMTFRSFWDQFLRVPGPDGALVAMVPHREQARFIEAVDSGRYHEFLLHWGKKASKSTCAAGLALFHLVAERHVPGERLVALTAWDAEQARIVFAQVCGFIDRHPWLTKHCQVLRDSIKYTETRRDPTTRTNYTLTHTIRAISRDTKGSHGEPWTLVVRDEAWVETDYTFAEGLITDPTRAAFARTIYTSYSPPILMWKRGAPLYDLVQRAEAGDPSLFYSYLGGTGEAATWRVVPYITEDWIEQQRRMFDTAPSKFKRTVLNEIAPGDGDGLISVTELRAALDPLWTEPTAGAAGTRYQFGLDVGLSNDHTALVVTTMEPRGAVRVVLTRLWRGTPTRPVDLTAVEREVISLARRFPPEQITVDQWQAALMVQRMQQAGFHAKTVTVESSRLDRIITILKRAFAGRHVRIGAHETALLDQLESVRVVEGRTARRDLVKFAPSGTGLDAGQHDDLVVALGLAMEQHGGEKIGRWALAEMKHCLLAANGVAGPESCVILGGHIGYMPDPICQQHCVGMRSARAMYQAWIEDGNPMIAFDEFVQTRVQLNTVGTHTRAMVNVRRLGI